MSRVRISSPAPNMAPWPSGKAKLCKSFTPQFKSGWCLQSKSSCITQEFFICRCGGIGRRKGLKIPRGQPRTGSSPVTGTKRNNRLRFLFSIKSLRSSAFCPLLSPHSNTPCLLRLRLRAPHQTRIKRTLMKIQSSFYFLQGIILDFKSNYKYITTFNRVF